MNETILFLKDEKDFEEFFATLSNPVYLLLDPSGVEQFAIVRELSKPHAYCLFDGEAKERAGLSAPYLVEWASIAKYNKGAFLKELNLGSAIILTSLHPAFLLKRRLKLFLYQNGDTQGYFQKFYTAINFEYFLMADRSFHNIFKEITSVAYRKFYERNDYTARSIERAS